LGRYGLRQRRVVKWETDPLTLDERRCTVGLGASDPTWRPPEHALVECAGICKGAEVAWGDFSLVVVGMQGKGFKLAG
jgi:hypothetical protein